VIGAITVAGLAPAGVLFGFAAFLISTGIFYGLPRGAAGNNGSLSILRGAYFDARSGRECRDA
jgi:hypothetical protein